MSRVLVTGGNGFLGRYLVRRLRAAGDTVAVVDKFPGENADTILIDFADERQPMRLPASQQVFHLAGLAHFVPTTPAECELFFAVNYGGTKRLLQALSHAERVPREFAFVSTVAVYGLSEGESIDEDHPRNASDPYGRSKILAEDAVREWGVKHGVKTTIFRLPLLVARDAPGNFGAMVRALRLGRYFGIGRGDARRSMVWVEDVCKGIMTGSSVGGVYHLTDGHHPSFLELETALTDALALPTLRRLPKWLARGMGTAGDAAQALTRRRMPFTSDTFRKMTLTLTFRDDLARSQFHWQPFEVVHKMKEILSYVD